MERLVEETQVSCQARCSSRQFVNSGGTQGRRSHRSASCGAARRGSRPSPAGLPDSDLSRCALLFPAVSGDCRRFPDRGRGALDECARGHGARLGEAGGRLAADLVSAGVEVHGYDPLITSSPEGVAMSDDPAAAVSRGTVVLALTTASTALSAAESALPGFRPDAIYADLNTSPALKDAIALGGEAGTVRGRRAARAGSRGLGTPLWRRAPARRRSQMRSDPGDARRGRVRPSRRRRDPQAPALGLHEGLAASALESLHAAAAAGHARWLEGKIAAVVGEPLLERLVEGVAATRRAASTRWKRRASCCSSSGSSRASSGRARRSSPNSLPAGSRTGARVHAMTRQQSGVTSPSDRARALVRGVRPARPRRSGRAPAADRRSRARSALLRARARGLRPEIALHVDR